VLFRSKALTHLYALRLKYNIELAYDFY